MNLFFSGNALNRKSFTPYCIKPVNLIIFTLLTVLCFLVSMAYAPSAHAAYGFGPSHYNAQQKFGNGIFFAPYQTQVYEAPNENSRLLEELVWRNDTRNTHTPIRSEKTGQSLPAYKPFIAFYPQLEVAMMSVIGDTENGWLEVIYDQEHNKTGWVKSNDRQGEGATSHFGTYQTWGNFMKYNAKAHGVYWLNGVDAYQRSIRTRSEDKAPLLPLTVIRKMKVLHVRGNWMLVEVLDFERNTPIGWVRWRDTEGHLLAFPNIPQETQQIMTTSL